MYILQDGQSQNHSPICQFSTMQLLRLLLVVAAALPVVAAVSGDAPFVKVGEYPSVGQLSTGCTGTLISPGVFLTAQHCLLNKPDSALIMEGLHVQFPKQNPSEVLGKSPLGPKIRVTKIIRSRDYFPFHQYKFMEELTKLNNLFKRSELSSEACECMEQWTYKGTKYYGCDARQPKCVTKGVCLGKPFKDCGKGKKLSFGSTILHLKAILRNIVRGEFMTIFRGDIALLFLDQCVVDRAPVQLDASKRNADDLTCEIPTGVGYGNINSAGVWGTKLGGGTGDLGMNKVARTYEPRILSPETCSYGKTWILKNYAMKKYFSDPTARLYRLKYFAMKIIDTQYKYYTKKYAHNVVGDDKPLICAAATTEKLQMLNRGDSGGPLFLRNVQVGVVSSLGGEGGIAGGVLGYYTKVSHYVDWITEHIETDECDVQPKRRSLRRSRRLKELPFYEAQRKYMFSKHDGWKLSEHLRKMDQCPALEFDLRDERRLHTWFRDADDELGHTENDSIGYRPPPPCSLYHGCKRPPRNQFSMPLPTHYDEDGENDSIGYRPPPPCSRSRCKHLHTRPRNRFSMPLRQHMRL